jgi:hypothetical protein
VHHAVARRGVQAVQRAGGPLELRGGVRKKSVLIIGFIHTETIKGKEKQEKGRLFVNVISISHQKISSHLPAVLLLTFSGIAKFSTSHTSSLAPSLRHWGGERGYRKGADIQILIIENMISTSAASGRHKECG